VVLVVGEDRGAGSLFGRAGRRLRRLYRSPEDAQSPDEQMQESKVTVDVCSFRRD
jgi:hypothetical protein